MCYLRCALPCMNAESLRRSNKFTFSLQKTKKRINFAPAIGIAEHRINVSDVS